MATYLPTIVLVLLAIGGLMARYQSRLRLQLPKELAALGGYAIGLLLVWLPISLVRAGIAFAFAVSADWTDVVTQVIPLFFVESLVMLLMLGRPLFQLEGIYDAQNEWWVSCREGIRMARPFLIVTSLLLLPALWMLQPGEYGVFKGSLVNALVSDSVEQLFQPTDAVTDLEQLRRIQNRAAIPHAIALATVLALCTFALRGMLQFMRGELNRDVIHMPYDYSDPTAHGIFNPRGGGRN